MAIRDSDKLLVGRGDTSYYVSLLDSGLGNDIPISGTKPGKPVTGDIDLDSGVNINIVGDGAGFNIQSGYWGGLFYDGNLQLEWGRSGVKTGTDIMMKGGHTDFNNTTAEEQYSNTGSRAPWDESLHGHGIHWLKAPEHKYDAVNKEYVDNKIPNVTGLATTSYVNERVLKTGSTMTGDLVFTDNNKVKTRFIDSGQNTNLTLSRNGEARIVCASDQITMQKPVRLVVNGTASDHAVTKSYVDSKVSSVSAPDLSAYATTTYVDDAINNIGSESVYVGTGKNIGRWYMSFHDPHSISSGSEGDIHKQNGNQFHISAKNMDGIDRSDYFDSLKVGDTFYIQKESKELETFTLTKANYDATKKVYNFAPLPPTSDNGRYYIFDGPGVKGNVPDPNPYTSFIEFYGQASSISSSSKITADRVWGLSSNGDRTGTSPNNGCFFPYKWMKKNYPQMTGFNISEGIGLSGLYDQNKSPKKIYDPTALTSNAKIQAKTIDGIPGIAIWFNTTVYGNYYTRLYGIQVPFDFD